MVEGAPRSVLASLDASKGKHELLLEEFILPLGITKYRVAKEIGVLAQRTGDGELKRIKPC